MNKTNIILAVLLAAAVTGCTRPEASGENAAVSPTAGASAEAPAPAPAPAPEVSAEEVLAERLVGYSATALDGSTYRIADKKGKVLLVNAWATWCGPCRYEIPELKRLYEEYGDDGLEIVGVSVDMQAAEPSVRQFVEVNSIKYPILLDPQSRLTMMLRTTSIPTSVMIDRHGNVVWRHIGIISEQRDQSFRDALALALGS